MASTAIQIELLEKDRFYQLAPHRPYYAKRKGSRTYIAGKETAFKFPYIQHNQPCLCSWMTFDIDHQNTQIWEEANLPEPNIIVRNLENKKCHISYAIESVCTSPAAKPKPLAYAASIEDAYRGALKADQCYTGLLTKNPYSDEFCPLYAHDYVFKLSELAGYVELECRYWTRKRAANTDQYGLGRNVALFHNLRYWAYSEIHAFRENGSSYDDWLRAVLSQSESYNAFESPLPYGEVKSTAKSVSRWVWTKYWPDGKPVRRGVMADSFAQSQLELDTTTKQRLSARRTNEVRRNDSEEKIINAIGQLTAQGKRVSVAAISRLSGLTRQALYKDYKHLINKKKCQLRCTSGNSSSPLHLKY